MVESDQEPRASGGLPGASGHRMTESAAVAMLERVLAWGQEQSGVRVGIGDDAAVLSRPTSDLVWTVDTSLEGTHFDLAWLTLEDVGWRSFQAAVSDIAAMGAVPLAALSNVALPSGCSPQSLEALASGQAAAARVCGCPVVGGNLARAATWQVTTTVLGTTRAPLLRVGARPGDELWLVGRVGLAAAGLRVLQRGIASRTALSAAVRVCLEAWRRPRALLREGQLLVGRAHAAMDLSDGLAADLPRLAASSGVRIVVERTLLKSALHPSLIDTSCELKLDALELALQGGEDYALVGTGPSERRPDIATTIGRVEPGQGAVITMGDHGTAELRGGFDHLIASV